MFCREGKEVSPRMRSSNATTTSKARRAEERGGRWCTEVEAHVGSHHDLWTAHPTLVRQHSTGSGRLKHLLLIPSYLARDKGMWCKVWQAMRRTKTFLESAEGSQYRWHVYMYATRGCRSHASPAESGNCSWARLNSVTNPKRRRDGTLGTDETT